MQRPSLASTEIPEVTAKLPILENPLANLKATRGTVLCGMTRLQEQYWAGDRLGMGGGVIHPAKQSVQAFLGVRGPMEGSVRKPAMR